MITLTKFEFGALAGGKLECGAGKSQNPIPRIDQSIPAQSSVAKVAVNQVDTDRSPIHLRRFDVNFMAPSDNESDEQPLFPGFNDQGGVV